MINPEKIWTSTTLPTLPVVAIRLIDLTKDPDVDFGEIVDVIKTDPAIAARILKAVNSSYIGLRNEVTSLEKAVPILGTTVLTSLALSFSLAPDSVKGGELDEHYSDIWLQSITHAAAGEVVGQKKCSFGIPCEYFLGGLFADIGRLAMFRAIPDEYRGVLEHIRETGASICDAESELLGFDHAEIGYRLLCEWKLPNTLCDAVKCHELSIEALMEQDENHAFDLIKAVRFAAGIGKYFHDPEERHGAQLNELRQGWAAFFAGDPDELDAFLHTVREKIESAGEMLHVDTSSLPDMAELTAQANLQLAEIAMRGHAETVEVSARNEELESERERLSQSNQELAAKATRDGITRLYNRQYFMEAGQQMVSRSARASERFGVIFMDIDRFKQLNDTHGHAFGDEVLVAVAGIMKDGMRRSDIVARYGGEEIVVLAEKLAGDELELICERLRADIEMADFVTDGQRVPVTASFGVCIADAPFDPAEDTLEVVVATADQAMYQSKHDGRNRVTYVSYMSPAGAAS